MKKKEERLGRGDLLGLRPRFSRFPRSPLARVLVSRTRILLRLKIKIRDCSQSKARIIFYGADRAFKYFTEGYK